MKHSALLLLIAVSLGAAAQSTELVHLHAFQQSVTPGIKGVGDIDENGTLLKKQASPLFNYFIYAINKTSDAIQPMQVWIKGKPFSVETDTLPKAPMVFKNRSDTVTEGRPLLPQTAGTILRLWPEPIGAAAPNLNAKRLAQQNEIVLVYKTVTGVQHGVLEKFAALPQGVLL